MNDSNQLLAAERMPARDEDGSVVHPDLELLMVDPPVGDDEQYIDADKVREAGYEAAYVTMDAQLAEEHPAYHRYFELGHGDFSGWEPEPPAGDGWRMVAAYDTDDGPAAMFVRPLQDAAA